MASIQYDLFDKTSRNHIILSVLNGGRLLSLSSESDDLSDRHICSRCNHAGDVDGEFCKACKGTGMVRGFDTIGNGRALKPMNEVISEAIKLIDKLKKKEVRE